jgi:hypothetical protein
VVVVILAVSGGESIQSGSSSGSNRIRDSGITCLLIPLQLLLVEVVLVLLKILILWRLLLVLILWHQRCR